MLCISTTPILLHDNASDNKALVAKADLRNCEFEELSHTDHSPDLAPFRFYLFPRLKGHLRGKHFEDENVRLRHVCGYRDKTKQYLSGTEKLCERYNKCITVHGDYVEK